MTVRKEVATQSKGDIIDEVELIFRIEQAVHDIIATDVDGTIKLHNLVCKGEVEVYESEGGEPLDRQGRVINEPDTTEFQYIFTKGEN